MPAPVQCVLFQHLIDPANLPSSSSGHDVGRTFDGYGTSTVHSHVSHDLSSLICVHRAGIGPCSPSKQVHRRIHIISHLNKPPQPAIPPCCCRCLLLLRIVSFDKSSTNRSFPALLRSAAQGEQRFADLATLADNISLPHAGVNAVARKHGSHFLVFSSSLFGEMLSLLRITAATHHGSTPYQDSCHHSRGLPGAFSPENVTTTDLTTAETVVVFWPFEVSFSSRESNRAKIYETDVLEPCRSAFGGRRALRQSTF